MSWPPALRLISMGLSRPLATVDWPRESLGSEGPDRGVPEFDVDSCTACGDCVITCPADCIILEETWLLPVVDGGACVRCGRCVVACGEEAVALTGARDLAAYSQHDLLMDERPAGERALDLSPSRIYRMAVTGGDGAPVDPATLLDAREGTLRRRRDDR
ncbi:MAG: hypothetical protein JSW25_05495 [Thermoplasmata archaeon]|nr:MAG: hypothetical protein JSW25_05495 [Thermoplasmata archaeon]